MAVRGSGRGGSVWAQSAKRASRAGLRVTGCCWARRVADSAAWSMRTLSSSGRVIASWPSQDGADRRAADQVGQAADHAAGALVQVLRLGGQGAGLVAVQPQGRLQGRDQLGPFGAVGERPGADQLAAPGELPAAGAGEHPAPLDVDPGVYKGRGQVLGEVLQVVGQVLPGGGAVVEVVDLIDQDQVGAGVDEDLADRVGDVGDVGPGPQRQAEEPGELHGQLARGALGRAGDVDHRDPAGPGREPGPDPQLVQPAELLDGWWSCRWPRPRTRSGRGGRRSPAGSSAPAAAPRR